MGQECVGRLATGVLVVTVRAFNIMVLCRSAGWFSVLELFSRQTSGPLCRTLRCSGCACVCALPPDLLVLRAQQWQCFQVLPDSVHEPL